MKKPSNIISILVFILAIVLLIKVIQDRKLREAESALAEYPVLKYEDSIDDSIVCIVKEFHLKKSIEGLCLQMESGRKFVILARPGMDFKLTEVVESGDIVSKKANTDQILIKHKKDNFQKGNFFHLTYELKEK